VVEAEKQDWEFLLGIQKNLKIFLASPEPIPKVASEIVSTSIHHEDRYPAE